MPTDWRPASSMTKGERNMSSKIDLFDVVALLVDLPEEGLVRGEVGTVVELYHSDHYEVEFSDNHGQTYAMLAVAGQDLLVLVHKRE
jgi:hypothetical protein